MKKTLQNLEIQNLIFLAVMILVIFAAFKIFQPYMNIIIISLVIVQAFHPFYHFIFRHTKSSALSTFLSIIITLLLVILPFVIILLLTFNEIKNFSDANNILDILGNLERYINETINNLNNISHGTFQMNTVNLRDVAVNFANSLKDQLLPITTQILSLSSEILFNLFLMLICLIYFFPMFDKLPEIISRISPLDDDVDKTLWEKLLQTTKGVLKGSFIVALLQATAVLIPLLFLQIGAPVLLWIIMVVLSIIPIGSGLVWAPIGFAIIIAGIRSGNSSQIILGVLLLVYSAIIINVIDTSVRPRLMKGTVNIHPLATIFSVLGGIYYFGVLGILYGPVIYILFMTIMEVYNKKFLKKIDDEIITAGPA